MTITNTKHLSYDCWRGLLDNQRSPSKTQIISMMRYLSEAQNALHILKVTVFRNCAVVVLKGGVRVMVVFCTAHLPGWQKGKSSMPLSNIHDHSPLVMRGVVILSLDGIKISGALSWKCYIPFTSLSFLEDVVWFLPTSLLWQLTCSWYCSVTSNGQNGCCQQQGLQDCATFKNFC